MAMSKKSIYSIAMAVVTAAVLGLCTAGWNKVAAEYKSFKSLQARAPEFVTGEDIKTLGEAIQQMSIDFKQFKQISLTVFGRARVLNDTAGECYIRINTAGRGSNYIGSPKARITNLSNEDTPAIEVPITGTFRNAEADYIAVLSRLAGSRIEARPGAWIDIKLEPIEAEK